MSVEKIVGAVVDTQRLTLYRSDGKTIEIPQGDPRVRGIIAQVMPILQSGPGAVAEVELTHMPNAYKDFEEKSSGVIRLFRVMKKAVASIFASPEEVTEVIQAGGTIGTVPSMAAIDEILAQGDSVSHPDFKDGETTDDHTMIAVVKDDAGNDTIIPGVEAIKPQFDYAGKLGSTKGMENFFRRLATVISNRPHSVQDLLRFLERGDLPIADDGCIVAYKLLYKRDGGVFVDPHTQRVTQRPGSYVCVDASLVDLSRRNECSNGLHIGRRGYMRSFSGDSMFMCKIAPEDVMVVPHNDPNKVRVKGYHIIAQVNDEAQSLIRRDQPATTNPETATLLSKVIAGKHAAPDQEVRITQQKGGGLLIRPIVNGKAVDIDMTTPPKEDHRALDDKGLVTADPKAVADQVSVAKGTGSRQERAKALMATVSTGTKEQAHTAAHELLALKKTSKVSWDSLGIDEAARQLLVDVSQGVMPEKKPEPLEAVTMPPKTEQASVTKAKSERALKIEAFETKMRDETKSSGVRFNAGHDLIAFRKRSKVSWERLGRSDLTDDAILNYINTLPKEAPKPEATAKPEPVKAKVPPAKMDLITAPSAMETGQQLINRTVNKRQATARGHFDQQEWTHLLNFKRKAKVSWAALGFNQSEINEIKLHVGD